ncbi:type 1 fimbrial protein [Providencia stuartii]|uniref:Type 1 fimbrial protein n=2 Tax=Providencia TaxID=586 RepID=A0AAI9HZJ0_PROST|nr:type 1 fimbrial protein [Providencia stuartii]ELR5045975.1 type 1 fimbrial protein [Providencia rettgeri]MTB38912.1 fimbrial protein [Providencia sp. wls1949]MTC08322.1 fimbrial protein [Providencia sp. wls1948]ELR5121882.1 type 1 fimbrial protein [Providencia stuartii]
MRNIMAFKTKLITAMLFTGVSFGAAAGDNSDNITLNGVITAVTCNVTANGGNSVFNVGTFAQNSFTPNVQNGDTALVVSLENCSADSDKGALYVQGTTTTANTAKNIFIGSDPTVGFMLQEDGKTDQVVANKAIPVTVSATQPTNYSFKVGMGSTDAVPAVGSYSAPIIIAYASE